jgi:NTE family protein
MTRSGDAPSLVYQPVAGSRSTPPTARAHPGEVVAFALQGGGSLSATQVGMLRALTESGVRPDLIIGSSAGALNAAAFGSDPTLEGLDRLELLWRSLRRATVAPVSGVTLLQALSGRGEGLVSNRALRRLLQSALPIRALDQTAIPVHVVATDLQTGRVVVLSDGDPVSALLASAAFPGLYPPVRIGTQVLIDGGVSADVPVLQAEALGATLTYVLPAALAEGAHAHPSGPLPLAYRALGQILDAVAQREIAATHGQIYLLPTITSRATNPVDFRDTARLIHQGHDIAAHWLTVRASNMDTAG